MARDGRRFRRAGAVEIRAARAHVRQRNVASCPVPGDAKPVHARPAPAGSSACAANLQAIRRRIAIARRLSGRCY
jgi:hypothetical protein